MIETVTVVVTPWVASEADYAALLQLFGVVLAVGVVISGVKAIHNLLIKPPEA